MSDDRRTNVERLEVERVGGFAGFGAPGSALRSRGSVDLAKLSAQDRAAVAALFAGPADARPTAVAGGTGVADGFRYRITRVGTDGVPQTVEVPEDATPARLRACVRDVLE